MELMKKSIHTERIKAKALLQIPIEEDMNVSDTKPDVGKLLFHRGRIKIDEIKTGVNKVWIRGRLLYSVLYVSDEKDAGLDMLEGEIPLTEEVYMEQAMAQDRVICATFLEDMRVSMINSRKLSVRAVITLKPRIMEHAEDEVCTDLNGYEDKRRGEPLRLEYQKKNLEYLESVVCKRDVFRIHEEATLQAGMGSVGKVLWKSADLSHITFRPLDEKISVFGDMNLFLIYREENSNEIKCYETSLSFHGNVECQGCWEKMTADIAYDIANEEITIREDSDGEDRVISVDMALELELLLQNIGSTQMVADVYGVTCNAEAITEKKEFRQLQYEGEIAEKLSGTFALQDAKQRILQICHNQAEMEIEECLLRDDAVTLRGDMKIGVLYTTGEEDIYFAYEDVRIPFEITRQILGMDLGMECSVLGQVEQLQVVIKEDNVVEWRATADIHMIVYRIQQEDILVDLNIGEIDAAKLETLPGFAIYFVQDGDSLWKIGKKYYVSVDNIKEVNGLSGNEVRPGDKLLIVKSGERAE
ncbi:MAG: DUF3794 domain-containing protein [Lachnospiraceae bacterium]|nr:DUF3794 domain-containing protein [Lachnospiraceae bacterium]